MQQDELEALVAEIDSILGEAAPRLPWVMSNDANQRQLLARARACLAEVKTAAAQPALEAGGRPADSADASQVLKALLQEMQYLRSQTMQILDPLRHEVATLREQRELLLQEVLQLQQQRVQIDQGAALHQLPPSWDAALQRMARELEAHLSTQVSQSVQRLELATANAYGLAQTPDDGYAALPGLTPTQRLEFLKQLQAQSDQLMLGLDQSLRTVFSTLQENIYAYQNSLNQGLSQMHTLGQQGELMFSALVNHLGQQINQDTMAYLESAQRRELPEPNLGNSMPEIADSQVFAPEGAAPQAGIPADLEADLAFEALDLGLELDDDEITLLQIEDEITELQLDSDLTAEGEGNLPPLDLQLLESLEAPVADPSTSVSLPETPVQDIRPEVTEAGIASDSVSALDDLYQSLFGNLLADATEPSQSVSGEALGDGLDQLAPASAETADAIEPLDTFLAADRPDADIDLGLDQLGDSAVDGFETDDSEAIDLSGALPRPEDLARLTQAADPSDDLSDIEAFDDSLDDLFGAGNSLSIAGVETAEAVDLPDAIASFDELLPALPDDVEPSIDGDDPLDGFMAASPEEDLLVQDDLPTTATPYDLAVDEAMVDQLQQDLENLEVSMGYDGASPAIASDRSAPSSGETFSPVSPEPEDSDRVEVEAAFPIDPESDRLFEPPLDDGGPTPFDATIAPDAPVLSRADSLDSTDNVTDGNDPIDRVLGLDLFQDSADGDGELDLDPVGLDLFGDLTEQADRLDQPVPTTTDELEPLIEESLPTFSAAELAPSSELSSVDLFGESADSEPETIAAPPPGIDLFGESADGELGAIAEPPPGIDLFGESADSEPEAIAESPPGIDLFDESVDGELGAIAAPPPGIDLFGDNDLSAERDSLSELRQPSGSADQVPPLDGPASSDSLSLASILSDLDLSLGAGEPAIGESGLTLDDLSAIADEPTPSPPSVEPQPPAPPVIGATGPSLTLENLLGDLTLDPLQPSDLPPPSGVTLDDLSVDSIFGDEDPSGDFSPSASGLTLDDLALGQADAAPAPSAPDLTLDNWGLGDPSPHLANSPDRDPWGQLQPSAEPDLTLDSWGQVQPPEVPEISRDSWQQPQPPHEPELNLDSWEPVQPQPANETDLDLDVSSQPSAEPDLTLDSWGQAETQPSAEPDLIDSWGVTPPSSPLPSAGEVMPLSLSLDDLNLSLEEEPAAPAESLDSLGWGLDDNAVDSDPSDPENSASLDDLTTLGEAWSEAEPASQPTPPQTPPSNTTDWRQELSLDNILDAVGTANLGDGAIDRSPETTPPDTVGTPDPIQAAAAAAAQSMEAMIDFINLDSLLGDSTLPPDEASEPSISLDSFDLDLTLDPEEVIPSIPQESESFLDDNLDELSSTEQTRTDAAAVPDTPATADDLFENGGIDTAEEIEWLPAATPPTAEPSIAARDTTGDLIADPEDLADPEDRSGDQSSEEKDLFLTPQADFLASEEVNLEPGEVNLEPEEVNLETMDLALELGELTPEAAEQSSEGEPVGLESVDLDSGIAEIEPTDLEPEQVEPQIEESAIDFPLEAAIAPVDLDTLAAISPAPAPTDLDGGVLEVSELDDLATADLSSLDPSLLDPMDLDIPAAATATAGTADLEPTAPLLAEPPTPASLPVAPASGPLWFLGLDVGTTGLSAVLLERQGGEVYPLYWVDNSMSGVTADKFFRLPTLATVVADDGSGRSRVQSVGSSALTVTWGAGDAADQDTVQLKALKPYLKLGIPNGESGQDVSQPSRQWPQIQWSDGDRLPLQVFQDSLRELLTTLLQGLTPDAPVTVGAVGLESDAMAMAMAHLRGVVVSYPANWPDAYTFNLREAVLGAGLTTNTDDIYFVEDAIAAVLSGLPDPATPLPEGNGQPMQQQTLYACPWTGGTVVISAGATVTEMGIVNLPRSLGDLTYDDFTLHSMGYAGDAIDLDIVCHLLHPIECRQRRPAEGFGRAAEAVGWSWQASLSELEGAQWADLDLDGCDLPRPAEPDTARRQRLYQRLEASLLGQSVLEAARHLKIILQHQPQFELELADQRWVVRSKDLEDRIILPYIQRINGYLNRLLSEANLSTQAVNQVICTGGSASLPKMARWLRQKFPNATIVQDTYHSDRPPSCSRVTYGLVNLVRYPQVLDLTRHQYSDMFLLMEILRTLPEQPMPLSGILHLLKERGLNVEACQAHLLALLEGRLPPGLLPSVTSGPLVLAPATDELVALATTPLFVRPNGQVYVPNLDQAQRLQHYMDQLLATKHQTLVDPLLSQLTVLNV